MDPVPLITDTNSSYNLAEIWAFSVNGVGDVSHGGFLHSVGPRRAQLVQNLAAETSNRDVSVDESTLTEQSAGGESKNHAWKKRRQLSEDESSKLIISSSSAGNNNTTDYQGKRLKVMAESREENVILKAEVEASSGFGNKQGEHSVQLPAEAPRQDYIHVRARRGQATDSHSLAERARREKISERMKILQDLVPGCNKVIGKALVLDEIINYIQSLQRQVEFLSMKLEAVNSRMNSSNLEGFPAKDLGVQTYEAANMAFGSQATASYGPRSPQEWLHMQVGGGFDRAT